MDDTRRAIRAPEWLIFIGGSIFVLVLAFSAYWEPDIRWLHFFQAWMYIATIVLGSKGSRWGYFIGISVAGLWDYANLFVTTFFVGGIEQMARWIHTGQLVRPDLLIAVPAWLSNLLVVAGCLWAYLRLPKKPRKDIIIFPVTFFLATGYFAAIMALFQPRYLALFPQMLHPHLP